MDGLSGKIGKGYKAALLVCGLLFLYSLRNFIAVENCKRGDAFLRCGLKSNALGQYKKALFAAPDYSYAYRRLANVYAELGEKKLELKTMEDAVSHVPDNENNLVELGRLYAQENDFQRAVFYFSAALKINPANKLAIIWSETCRQHISTQQKSK